jgi:nitrite reductase/ring-hydroxylating ferredoxin subunit
MANFIRVAALTDLPAGSCMTVQANGKAVALYNVEGTVFATDNTCLHRGGPLGDGQLEGDVVTCPWHMWQYNVRTGENVMNPSVKVATYEVKVENGEIKVAV